MRISLLYQLRIFAFFKTRRFEITIYKSQLFFKQKNLKMKSYYIGFNDLVITLNGTTSQIDIIEPKDDEY